MNEIKIRNKVIIWGKDGYNVLGLLRQLHAYAEVYFLMVGGSRFCAVKSKYCKNLVKTSNFDEGLKWLMESFSNEEHKPFIITTGDLAAEYVDQHYDVLSKWFFITGTSQQGQLTKVDDKAYMNNIAVECGFKIPQSIVCNKHTDISRVQYPCILKPLNKHSGHESPFKTKICNDKTELQDVINKIEEGATLLLQEFVPKKADALVYGCRTFSGEVILAGVIVRNRWDGADSGDGSFGYITDELPSRISKNSIERFLQEIAYYGLFSVEYGITDMEAYFYEFNLRNDGTSNYFNQAGCNIPLIWIMDTIGADYSQLAQSVTGKHIYIAEDDDYINVKKGVITKEQYKKDLASATVFRRYDPDDMKPYYYNKLLLRIMPVRRYIREILMRFKK